VHSKHALEHTFSAKGEELERIEVFKYLVGSSHMMMLIPRPCGVTRERNVGAGLESPVCCGLKTRHSKRAGCSIR
jgi:hypothetical protein